MEELDREVCYRAIAARDRRFDGRFFMGVRTTGIYCRPICPARTPREENVEIYACAAAAEAAGFRPCKRCRPEAAPGGGAWRGGSAAVERALRLIEAGALDEGGVEALAERVGLGSRQLTRLFMKHLGASPVAVAQSRRVHFARELVERSALPMIEVAHAAGFGSLRRFNALFKQVYGEAPSAARERRAEGALRAGLECKLAIREPYDWEGVLEFLETRALDGVERVAGGVYERTIRWAGAPGLIEVWRGGPDHLVVRATLEQSAGAIRLVERVRRMFDCDADPEAIGALLGADPLLAPLVHERPGLRLPSGWELFEAAARGILGQQVSVKAARTLGERLVRRCGEQVGERWLFPTPEALLEAELDGLGLPKQRVMALKALAVAAQEGALERAAQRGAEAFVTELCELPGVGPWTAQYVAMRGLGEPDAFPSADLAIKQVLAGMDVEQRAQGWRPWRAYAVLHIWASRGA